MDKSYYDHLLESAREVASLSPKIRRIQLAGKTIELVFSNTLLEDKLFPALAHLAEPENDVINSLKVYIWDSRTSGKELPIPDVKLVKKYIRRGEGWGTNFRDRSVSAHRILYSPAPNENLFAIDPETRTAVYWFPDPERIPYYERGAPFRLLFDSWLAEDGLLLTHAAAVGSEYGGAFIAGKGGKGKSTSAISCLTNNTLGYLADDYLILKPAPDPQAYSLYSTGKLNVDHLLERTPNLLPIVENRDEMDSEKGLFFFHQHYPESLYQQLALRVALIPKVYEGSEARISKSNPGQLLLGLAASTIYQSQFMGQWALTALAETLGGLPCYQLEIGSDLESIGPCIEKVIRANAHD